MKGPTNSTVQESSEVHTELSGNRETTLAPLFLSIEHLLTYCISLNMLLILNWCKEKNVKKKKGKLEMKEKKII